MAAREGVVSTAGSDAVRETGAPRSWYRDAEGRVHRDLPPRELVQAARAPGGTLWVDIDSTNRHQIALLEKVFEFHHLAIEDTLNPNSRVKLEEYPGYLFLIVRGVRFQEETDDPYDLETFNLCFFLGPHFLVTVHRTDTSVCDEAAELTRKIVSDLASTYTPADLDVTKSFLTKSRARAFESWDASRVASPSSANPATRAG